MTTQEQLEAAINALQRDRAAEMQRLEQAARGGDLQAVLELADLMAKTDVTRAATLLEHVRVSTPKAELFLMRKLVMYAEWAKRACLGLPVYHIESFADLGFPHAVEAYQRYKRAVAANPDKLADALYVYLHDGGKDRAVFAQAAFGEVVRAVDYNMPPESPERDGPADAKPAIWLGCDTRYHAFAKPFMRSIQAFGDYDVILHTFPEHPMGPKFYASERLVEVWQWMEAHNRPVWMMDVDAIANRPLTELFAQLKDHDVAMRGRPGRLEPWNQINASVVGFNNTAGGKTFLKSVAAFIHRAAERDGRGWCLDQTSLLCCARALNPAVKFLQADAVNYDYTPDGIIWCNSGVNKWLHLQPGFMDPERQTYLDAFRKFV